MARAAGSQPSRFPLAGTSALLIALMVAINAVAIGGMLAAREGAGKAAVVDLELRATADARALEALLATLRGDLALLSQSPPLSAALARLSSADPVARRWARLDVEATLLLFLSAHAGLERIQVLARGGRVVARAGRRDDVPVLLASEVVMLPPGRPELYVARWPMAPDPAVLPRAVDGEIEVWLAPHRLLRTLGSPGALTLELAGGGAAAAGGLRARVPVRDERWQPPIAWTLVRTESQSRLVQSIETLAGQYRTTLILNLVVMALALLLGNVAYRQARRAAHLEADREHQRRLRELERQLLHAERLASVGRLAAGIAHEINNPLEGIGNYLALVDEDLAAARLDETRALTGKVREGVARVAAITGQVLSFADPGRAPKAPLDLVPLLEETVSFVRSIPAFRAIRLSTEFPAEPLAVRGNATTLGQLFLNLLLNACEVQPSGGEVVLAARREGSGRVAVAVADRGPGFSAEAREHLFEPFYSGRGSTGLGLAICYGITADHGGAIRVANRTGGGARVDVELPLALSAEEEGAIAAAAGLAVRAAGEDG